MAGRRIDSLTCGKSCRQKRARRLRSQKREQAQMDRAPAAVRTISEMVRRYQPDEVKNVLHEELRPIVREALTEETLRAIQRLLGLTDRAVQVVQEDLESEDPALRSKAAALLLKYTVGHPALVKADDADGSKQIVVNFALDRPDTVELADAESEVTEMRTCDLCDTEKPATEFVGSSERCMQCQDEWKQRIIDSVS